MFRGRIVTLLMATVGGVVLAADVMRPAEVTGLAVARASADVVLTWPAVALDVGGNPETVVGHRVYRGTAPDFTPDTVGGSNRIGGGVETTFTDSGAAANATSYYYLVSAVDAAGNESTTKPSKVTQAPVLSGYWTEATIELQWTPAAPADQVAGYRVYYGRRPRQYEFVQEVGGTSASLAGLELGVNWYTAVTAVDLAGNESALSNEHADAVAGRVRVRAHDEDYLCWGAAKCPPPPGAVQRNDGWQLMIPTEFPVGDWVKVAVTFTIDSRLCTPPAQGTTDKCGDTNPGGYNPCGDPWDRTAHLFLVLDDCLNGGGSCITSNNLELMRAITPFGTDAAPPDGSGVVPPRVLTLDITPWTPLLTGQKYVGVEIGHYVQAGWRVTVDFDFSKRPEEASPKPPAAGIQVIGFGSAPLAARQATIPATATQVYGRLFTTGHGGTLYCDGGSNDGGSCTSSSQCPGGSCQNCDEFCHRTNRILADGVPVWQGVPWRECCVPKYAGDRFCQGCTLWNACGYPSCTYDRAGWCPGYLACHKDSPCDQDLELTSALPPGSTRAVSYDVLVQRGPWSVSLVLYWYE